MFKDYNKYLSASLKVYLFVLIIIFILKLVGLDYFGIDTNNPILLKLCSFCLQYHLKDIWYTFTLWLYSYFIISIACDCNNIKIKLYSILCIPISFGVAYLETKFSIMVINCFIDFLYLLLLSILFNIKYKNISNKKLIINYVKIVMLNLVFQIISSITRIGYFEKYNYNFIINIILDFDYILLFLIYYHLHFKGGTEKCLEMVVGSFLQMKANLRNLLKKSQKNLHNFKTKSKQEKYAILIYVFLSLIWNTLSVLVVLFIAKLNNTLTECIFILSSFWLSKRTFGKAFHLKSMTQCFIVSNITYYVLNRITTTLGISIIVPIMLGVGLSYVTSKLTKKLYKPLYRGMPKDLFEETILKVEDKGNIRYNICYEYYIEKKMAISLSMKYHYSEAGIRKILKIVNKKIKELNK